MQNFTCEVVKDQFIVYAQESKELQKSAVFYGRVGQAQFLVRRAPVKNGEGQSDKNFFVWYAHLTTAGKTTKTGKHHMHMVTTGPEGLAEVVVDVANAKGNSKIWFNANSRSNVQKYRALAFPGQKNFKTGQTVTPRPSLTASVSIPVIN
jgi:hypothetical protein